MPFHLRAIESELYGNLVGLIGLSQGPALWKLSYSMQQSYQEDTNKNLDSIPSPL